MKKKPQPKHAKGGVLDKLWGNLKDTGLGIADTVMGMAGATDVIGANDYTNKNGKLDKFSKAVAPIAGQVVGSMAGVPPSVVAAAQGMGGGVNGGIVAGQQQSQMQTQLEQQQYQQQLIQNRQRTPTLTGTLPTMGVNNSGYYADGGHIAASESTGTSRNKPFQGYQKPIKRTAAQEKQARELNIQGQNEDIKQVGKTAMTGLKLAFPPAVPFIDGAEAAYNGYEALTTDDPNNRSGARFGAAALSVLKSRRSGISPYGLVSMGLDFLPDSALNPSPPKKAMGGPVTPEYEVEQGEVVQGHGVQLEEGTQTASDIHEVEGDKHHSGGTMGAGGERVFSDQLKDPVTKKTFAELAEKIGRVKGKQEGKLTSHDMITRTTGELMTKKQDRKLDSLFAVQEFLKGEPVAPQMGVPSFADGGKTPGSNLRTGVYNNSLHVAPKTNSDRNATHAYLEEFNQDPRGLQELYGLGIDDIDDPINPGQKVNYQTLQARRRNPQEYARMQQSSAYTQGKYGRYEDYLSSQFEQGKTRLMQRAVANPQVPVFNQQAIELAKSVRGQNFMRETEYSTDPLKRHLKANTGSMSVAPGSTLKMANGGDLATQQALNKKGYKLDEDGKWGSRSQAALDDYNGLNAPLEMRSALPGPWTPPTQVTGVPVYADSSNPPSRVPWDKIGSAAQSMLPYVDNFANALLPTPEVAKPQYLDAPRLNTTVDINPELGQVNQTLRATQQGMDTGANNAGVARANKIATMVGSQGIIGQLFGNKRNQEAQLQNQQAQVNQQTNQVNAGLTNQYQQQQYARANQVNENLSANVANLAMDAQGQLKDQNMRDADVRKMEILAPIFARTGVLARKEAQQLRDEYGLESAAKMLGMKPEQLLQKTQGNQ